jgi:hypothetical protein
MPSKLVSNLDEVKGITAFTFVANRIIGKNILSHLCIKLALMPRRGEGGGGGGHLIKLFLKPNTRR